MKAALLAADSKQDQAEEVARIEAQIEAEVEADVEAVARAGFAAARRGDAPVLADLLLDRGLPPTCATRRATAC